MESQQRMGLEPITPEESELKETGFFEQARAELMRGIKSTVDQEFTEYINALRGELLVHGYTIVEVPVEGCDDSSF